MSAFKFNKGDYGVTVDHIFDMGLPRKAARVIRVMQNGYYDIQVWCSDHQHWSGREYVTQWTFERLYKRAFDLDLALAGVDPKLAKIATKNHKKGRR